MKLKKRILAIVSLLVAVSIAIPQDRMWLAENKESINMENPYHLSMVRTTETSAPTPICVTPTPPMCIIPTPCADYMFFLTDGEKITECYGGPYGEGYEYEITIPGWDAVQQFQKEGYTLIGWTDGNNTYKPGDKYNLISVKGSVLTAVYEPIETSTPTPMPTPKICADYFFYFTDGGEIKQYYGLIYAVGYEYEITIPEWDTFQRFQKEGYTLIGWTDGSNTYRPGDKYSISFEKSVLTAVYEPIETSTPTPTPPTCVIPTPRADYYVRFTDGGEKEEKYRCIYAVGHEYEITIPEWDTFQRFQKEGYTLIGWTDGSNTYRPGDKYKINPEKPVLTAVYEPIVICVIPTPPPKKVELNKVKLESVESNTKNQVKIVFQKLSNTDGYQVVYAADKKFTKNKKYKYGKNCKCVKACSLTLKKYTKDKIYVKVRGFRYNDQGKREYGEFSEIKSTRIAKLDTVKMKSVSRKSSNQAKIAIQKVAGADGYQIVYATNNNFTKGKESRATKKRNVVIKDLQKDTTYYIKVRAYKKNSNGEREYSAFNQIKILK